MREPYQIMAEFPDDLFTLLQDYQHDKDGLNEQLKKELQDLSQTESEEERQLESWHTGSLREINDRAQRQKSHYDANANVKTAEAEKRHKETLAQAQEMQNWLEEMSKEFDKQILNCVRRREGMENLEISTAGALDMLREEANNLPPKAEDYTAPVFALKKEADEAYQKIWQHLSEMRAQADAEYSDAAAQNRSELQKNVGESSACQQKELNEHAAEYSRRQAVQQQTTARRRAEHTQSAAVRRKELEEALRRQFVQDLEPEQVKQAYETVVRSEAQYKGYTPAKHNGDGLLFGRSRCDLTSYLDDEVVRECLEQHFGYALRRTGSSTYLELPCGTAFTDKNFSSIIEYPKNLRDIVVSNLNAMTMQLFMTNVAGKVRFTFISPSDAGEAFASFMRFADVDERLVDTHVWGNSQRIEERLDVLLDRAQTINQDYLRGQYADILEYNQAAGKNAEPLQFLMVVDFPRGFTQAALEKLENIMSNGPKNGIYTILAGEVGELDGSNDANDPRYNAVLQRIVQHLSRYRYENGMLCVPPRPSSAIRAGHPHANPQVQYLPLQLPENRVELDDAIETMKKAVYNADRVTITYDDVTSGLTHQPDRWFRYSDEKGISVPFALSGANKVLSLELASDALSPKYHTLVTGMIGSGKSTLLHTLIMGLLMKYSPEDVQIYLMDFKDGVEFKVYTEYNLKNFRAISIDTEPEFGLAVLKKIEAEMQARNNIFKQEGCRGLEGYRREMAEKGNPHHGMPRTILIIDEFQEAFGRSDDPVMSEAAEIIKRLTLVGRAPAIYLIMATQDIKNAAALPETVYNQFETRIALKSSPDSARIILPDNPMADQLINLDKGVAIFNASAGNKDHNVQCRIAFCSEDEQRTLLEQIAQKQAAADFQVTGGTRLLLSSIQDDRSNPLNHFANMGTLFDHEDADGLGYRLFVGEELSMLNKLHPELTSRKGQNLLLTGRDQGRVRTTTAFVVMSLLYESLRLQESAAHPLITLFDFGVDTGSGDLLNQMVRTLPEGTIRRYGMPDVLDGIDTLLQEKNSGFRQFVVIFGLNRARRLLVQPDIYSVAPKNKLIELLQTGPENGMNFIVWANSVESFMENYNETLGSFEHRLVSDIQDDQYSIFTYAPAPGSMKPKNAIYFNMDNTENPKIRLYEKPSDDWTGRFIRNMEHELAEKQSAEKNKPNDTEWW